MKRKEKFRRDKTTHLWEMAGGNKRNRTVGICDQKREGNSKGAPHRLSANDRGGSYSP